MDQDLPSFKKPPVIETAISLQFKAVDGLTNAHLGLFWDRHLRQQYPKAVDAPLIEPQTELFGDQISRRLRLPTFRVLAAEAATRLQTISADDRTMVQIQNGRIVFNWRKLNDEEYPRWRLVLPAFEVAIAGFHDFLHSQGFPPIEPNQWEVTYVNHLLKSREWEAPADWPKLLPGLIGTAPGASSGTLEALNCNFRFVLPEDSGRLHVEVHHGFTGLEQDAAEILGLQLTARGGIGPAAERDVVKGLATGHSAIVRKFTELTGSEAHMKWERER